MIASLSQWRIKQRLQPSYLNTLRNYPLGAVFGEASVTAPNVQLVPLETPGLAPLTGAPIIVGEADFSAVQFNPAMLPVIQEVMLIREKYRDTQKLIANMNTVKGLAQLLRDVRLRGNPPRDKLDKWQAAATALNAGIDALFSWAKDMCVEFLTFLPGWISKKISNSGLRNAALNAINTIITGLGGVDMTCAKFVDFVRSAVFDEYVFPYLNEIIGEKVIDVTNKTQTMYGTKSLEEKEKISSVVAELKKLNATIPAFTNPGGAGTPLPPLPPLPNASDFEGDSSSKTELGLSTTTKALIGGAAVLGVIGIVVAVRSGQRSSYEPYYYDQRPPRRRDDDYDDYESGEDDEDDDSKKGARSQQKKPKNKKRINSLMIDVEGDEL